jgi:protein-disulfide isomerase
VIDGNLQLSIQDEPVIGPPDAKTLVVVMFDYCCPHCRRTHEYLLHALERYPGQLGVVCLPLPLDADCNSTIDETEPRFEHACDLARLALAVRQADASAFVEYDRWLFEPEMPRDLQEAHAQAEQLVDAAALEAALKDEGLDAVIARHVKAYEQSGAERIPLIMSPGFASIVGRPESEEQLFELFETELGLMPTESH